MIMLVDLLFNKWPIFVYVSYITTEKDKDWECSKHGNSDIDFRFRILNVIMGRYCINIIIIFRGIYINIEGEHRTKKRYQEVIGIIFEI